MEHRLGSGVPGLHREQQRRRLFNSRATCASSTGRAARVMASASRYSASDSSSLPLSLSKSARPPRAVVRSTLLAGTAARQS